MSLDGAHELGIEYLAAVLLGILLMWLRYRIQLRRAMKAPIRIGFTIRNENDRRQETNTEPMRGGATERRQGERRD